MTAPPDQPSSLDYPEIIIGMAGPIGVDLDLITRTLQTILEGVGYNSTLIKLTTEMDRYPINDQDLKADVEQWSGTDTFDTYMRKMSAANALRKQYRDPAVLARIAVDAIGSERGQAKFKPKHSYIVRQLKRPEEVALLRRIYGRQFVLVSAYAPENERRERLCSRLRGELSTSKKQHEILHLAHRLIERDGSEDDEALGQQLRETFHLADVFIHGLNKAEIEEKLRRFIHALWGRNEITPSKDEYGMYAAKSASLRSADLSRQVGAALFSDDGELITQGCNEVPKAGGGSYWDLELPDNRDIKKGFDPNDQHKKEILRDLVERLRKRDLLSESALGKESDAAVVDALIAKPKDGSPAGALVGARIMDLTEYGRVVHAEMLAICDAARLGRSVKGATLFCTTFPCHNCTKHLLASGIKRVVYMEPYPKSRAKELHPDEIEIEAEVDGKVGFVPFLGISPYRYRDIFQKDRRKDQKGHAEDWYRGQKRPMVEALLPIKENEQWALGPLLGEIQPAPAASGDTTDSAE